MSDDLKRLRERELARVEADAPARAAGSPGVFLISNASTTTKAGQFFAANPAVITGPEVEGGPATITRDLATRIYVMERGANVPPSGAAITATGVPYRWIHDTDGDPATGAAPATVCDPCVDLFVSLFPGNLGPLSLSYPKGSGGSYVSPFGGGGGGIFKYPTCGVGWTWCIAATDLVMDTCNWSVPPFVRVGTFPISFSLRCAGEALTLSASYLSDYAGGVPPNVFYLVGGQAPNPYPLPCFPYGTGFAGQGPRLGTPGDPTACSTPTGRVAPVVARKDVMIPLSAVAKPLNLSVDMGTLGTHAIGVVTITG